MSKINKNWRNSYYFSKYQRRLYRDFGYESGHKNPKTVLSELLDKRTPAYAEADVHVDAGGSSHQGTLDRIIEALKTLHQHNV